MRVLVYDFTVVCEYFVHFLIRNHLKKKIEQRNGVTWYFKIIIILIIILLPSWIKETKTILQPKNLRSIRTKSDRNWQEKWNFPWKLREICGKLQNFIFRLIGNLFRARDFFYHPSVGCTAIFPLYSLWPVIIIITTLYFSYYVGT